MPIQPTSTCLPSSMPEKASFLTLVMFYWIKLPRCWQTGNRTGKALGPSHNRVVFSMYNLVETIEKKSLTKTKHILKICRCLLNNHLSSHWMSMYCCFNSLYFLLQRPLGSSEPLPRQRWETQTFQKLQHILFTVELFLVFSWILTFVSLWFLILHIAQCLLRTTWTFK